LLVVQWWGGIRTGLHRQAVVRRYYRYRCESPQE
jgi:hypothetical protein